MSDQGSDLLSYGVSEDEDLQGYEEGAEEEQSYPAEEPEGEGEVRSAAVPSACCALLSRAAARLPQSPITRGIPAHLHAGPGRAC